MVGYRITQRRGGKTVELSTCTADSPQCHEHGRLLHLGCGRRRQELVSPRHPSKQNRANLYQFLFCDDGCDNIDLHLWNRWIRADWLYPIEITISTRRRVTKSWWPIWTTWQRFQFSWGIIELYVPIRREVSKVRPAMTVIVSNCLRWAYCWTAQSILIEFVNRWRTWSNWRLVSHKSPSPRPKDETKRNSITLSPSPIYETWLPSSVFFLLLKFMTLFSRERVINFVYQQLDWDAYFQSAFSQVNISLTPTHPVVMTAPSISGRHVH